MDIRPEGERRNVLSEIRLGSYLVHYHAGILTSHTKSTLKLNFHMSNKINKQTEIFSFGNFLSSRDKPILFLNCNLLKNVVNSDAAYLLMPTILFRGHPANLEHS